MRIAVTTVRFGRFGRVEPMRTPLDKRPEVPSEPADISQFHGNGTGINEGCS